MPVEVKTSDRELLLKLQGGEEAGEETRMRLTAPMRKSEIRTPVASLSMRRKIQLMLSTMASRLLGPTYRYRHHDGPLPRACTRGMLVYELNTRAIALALRGLCTSILAAPDAYQLALFCARTGAYAPIGVPSLIEPPAPGQVTPEQLGMIRDELEEVLLHAVCADPRAAAERATSRRAGRALPALTLSHPDDRQWNLPLMYASVASEQCGEGDWSAWARLMAFNVEDLRWLELNRPADVASPPGVVSEFHRCGLCNRYDPVQGFSRRTLRAWTAPAVDTPCAWAGCPAAPAPASASAAAAAADEPTKKLKVKPCSGCESVSYCSKACQNADWRGHKVACRAKQAAIKAGDMMVSKLVHVDEQIRSHSAHALTVTVAWV